MKTCQRSHFHYAKSQQYITESVQCPLLGRPDCFFHLDLSPHSTPKMKTSSKDPTPILRRSKRKRASNSSKKEVDVFLAMALHLSPIKPNGSNMVFSPFSLRALLSLCAAGASAPTAEQLLSFMKSESIDDLNSVSSKLFSKVLAHSSNPRAPKLTLANGLWIHEGLSLKHSFKQVVDNVYKADIHRSDFTTQAGEIVSEVNSWAKDKTNGLITDIMRHGSVTEIDRLILTNALYFKAAWSSNYFRKACYTEKYDFHLLDGKSVKVPFMKGTDFGHFIGVFDDFKVLRIDYQKRYDDETRFFMYMFLPDSVDGLAALAERVSSEPDFLDLHLSDKHVTYKYVNYDNFRIPKFKFSYGFDATETLKRLGVTSPFEAGALSEMVDPPEAGQALFLKDIHQKAFIAVDEEGTTAAAVSRSLCGGGCPTVSPNNVDFVADHPFMFLIREDTSGAVLFLGHVLNPLKE